MKILALDYGDKRIGLALGDTQAHIAVPYGVLENRGRTSVLHELKILIRKEHIEKILVGIPFALRTRGNVRLSDVANEQMQKVLRFIDDVRNAISIPLDTIDERLSTREAEHRTRRQKKNVVAPRDAIAAAIILQSYLDMNHES